MGTKTRLAKGILRGPDTTRAPGEYRNPIDPSDMPSLTDIAASADRTRSMVTTFPAISVGVAYLYHKGVIEGSDRTWSLGDIIIVSLVAYGVMSFGVKRRWGGS
jgi:hypothetical protein